MALSDLILSAGKIVVILSDSTLGIAPNGKALNFGSVQLVNDLCDITEVGASVWFDINTSIPFMIISGTTFYLVNENEIIGSETIF